jgi:hypothetical protein
MARQEQMNNAVSFPTSARMRSTKATGTKTSSQLSDGFSDGFNVSIVVVLILDYSPGASRQIIFNPSSVS